MAAILLRPALVLAAPAAISWALLMKTCEQAAATILYHDHSKYSTSRMMVGHLGGAVSAGIFVVARDATMKPVIAPIDEAASEAAAKTRNPITLMKNSVAHLARQYPRPLLMYWITNYFGSAIVAGVAGSATLKFLVGTGEKKKLTWSDDEEDVK